MTEKVIKIISEAQGIPTEKITPETNLVSELGMNSYDVIALVTRFEDAFQIEIPDRSIKKLQTVRDISEFLSKA